MKISIVTTLYKSAPYIEEFYERSRKTVSKITNDYQIIFVDDGSPDDGLEKAIALSKIDNHVITIELSRNFGHHKAMMTGLSHATGNLIFLIDSDLEESPEWLFSFFEQMQKEQCDVVYGVQENRKGKIFERWSGEIFYMFNRFLTGINLPKNVVTTRLMNEKYVKSLLLFEEREVFLAGLWYITGFDQRPQIVKKSETSETTYTFRHKISLLINSITSFSNKPLVFIFYFGITVLFSSITFILYLILNWLLLSHPLSGWTSVMASIWLMGGFIISFIGIIGIYLSKIFSETKRRPYTIIRSIYEKNK